MHRLCYTCMTQHVCKIVLCIVWRRRLPFQVVYTMHNTSRESRKVVAACWSQSLQEWCARFSQACFCLCLCLSLRLSWLYLSLRFLSLSFCRFPSESVRQLCVACKVSLYVYFCWLRYWRILTVRHCNGWTPQHLDSSHQDQAVLYVTLHFEHWSDSLPDRDGIRTHGIFAFLWLIIVDFLEVWNPHVVQVCNTILLYVVIICAQP
jgi:hypothetical protein